MVLLGAANNRAVCEANARVLRERGVRVVDAVATLSLTVACAVVKQCALAVGADTALTHVAAAFGVPNVTVLGGRHFGRFLPYDKSSSVACVPLACYGCDGACHYRQAHCIKAVRAVTIERACREALEHSGDRPRVYAQGPAYTELPADGPTIARPDIFLSDVSVEYIAVGGEIEVRADGATERLSERLAKVVAKIDAGSRDNKDFVRASELLVALGRRDTAARFLEVASRNGADILYCANFVPTKDADWSRRQASCAAALAGVVPSVNIRYADEPVVLPAGWMDAPILIRSARDVVSGGEKRKPLVTDLFDAACAQAQSRGLSVFAVLNSDVVVTPKLRGRLTAEFARGRESVVVSRTEIRDYEGVTYDAGVLYLGFDLFAVSVEAWKRERARFGDYVFGERAWDDIWTAILMSHTLGCVLWEHGLLLHPVHPTSWLYGPYSDHNLSLFWDHDAVYAARFRRLYHAARERGLGSGDVFDAEALVKAIFRLPIPENRTAVCVVGNGNADALRLTVRDILRKRDGCYRLFAVDSGAASQAAMRDLLVCADVRAFAVVEETADEVKRREAVAALTDNAETVEYVTVGDDAEEPGLGRRCTALLDEGKTDEAYRLALAASWQHPGNVVLRELCGKLEQAAVGRYRLFDYSGMIASAKDEGRYVNICMVTYNRLEYTKQAIASLREKTAYPFRLTVIDNASGDGTREYLAECKACGLIDDAVFLPENVGVGKAANIGWLRDPAAPYYVKIDNDMVVKKEHWLAEMVRVIDMMPQAGMVGCNVEPVTYPAVRTGRTIIRVKEGTLGGGCVLIPKRTHDLLGDWCDEYGLYGEEDADYGRRVLSAGLQNVYLYDGDLIFHLPAGKAAAIDPITFEAKDGKEEHEDPAYRRWKDEQRRRNVEHGTFRKNVEAYRSGARPLYFASAVRESRWVKGGSDD